MMHGGNGKGLLDGWLSSFDKLVIHVSGCEYLMYIYLMNGLFICHMLRVRYVSNMLEYKPSLKLLTINRRTG